DGLDPTSELSRDRFPLAEKFVDVEGQILRHRESLEEMEHRTDFTGRTSGDVEEGEQLVVRSALESLSDVVRDGDNGSFHLVLQVPDTVQPPGSRQLEQP